MWNIFFPKGVFGQEYLQAPEQHVDPKDIYYRRFIYSVTVTSSIDCSILFSASVRLASGVIVV